MKPMVSFVAMAMMLLLQCEARAQIRLQFPEILPPPDSGSTNLNLAFTNRPTGKLFQPLSPLPESPLPKTPLIEPPVDHFSPGQQIPPGIYKTEPYAGIVLVPGPEHDDCSVIGAGSANTFSTMPIINPGVTIIPLARVKP